MWKHIDQATGEKLEVICDKHFQGGKCDGCPLLKVCDDPRRPNETPAEFSQRWETAMSELLAQLEVNA